MIALIVAYSKNHAIGNKGSIPWKITGEQKRFKELTTGNVVIMGRNSYEEIGKPLPERTTIVISNTKKFQGENLYTACSLKEAIKLSPNKDIYIAGGSKLYNEAIEIVDKMYITEIDEFIEGDTFFPEFDEEKSIKEINEHINGNIPYTYLTYTRKKEKYNE